jgi:uncharacterized protein
MKQIGNIVPAGMWQAAEPVADTVLVGCSMAPGFEFADFELLDPESEQAIWMRSNHPNMSKFTRSD